MIKTITVTNNKGISLEMELTNPKKSGFIVKSITGLNPFKANINTTDYAAIDGSIYNSSRGTYRNIVLNLLFYGPNIELNRLTCYNFFPVKENIKLRFVTDSRDVTIDGYVETNEIDIFSNQEGAQISVICPDPYFYSTDTYGESFYGITPGFEFPFSNESVTDPMMSFGEIVSDKSKNIYYDGDYENGMTMYLKFSNNVSDLIVYNSYTREYMQINSDVIERNTGSGFKEGDELIISTTKGYKYIYLMREGVEYNVLNALDRKSTWLELKKGDNVLSFSWTGIDTAVQINILAKIKYIGI